MPIPQSQKVEILDSIVHHHYASPGGSATAFGEHVSQPEDVEICILAELGAAISRGAAGIRETRPFPSDPAPGWTSVPYEQLPISMNAEKTILTTTYARRRMA